MKTGTVKWFGHQSGYGFITDSEDGTDFFVHYTGINSPDKFKMLEEGDIVTFDVIDTEKGRQAINVTVVEDEVEGEM